MKRATAAAFAALVLLARPVASRAEEPMPPEAEEDPGEIEVHIVGSRGDSVRTIPGSGTVITEEQLERADPRDVSEMLRRVPGIQARQDTAAGQRFDVGVRGLESGRSRRVLVLEDGIPIGLNPYAEPDLFYAPPIERVRTIEVVKGSGSILYGPQTLGGVINFVTVAPPDHRRAMVEVEGGQHAYFGAVARYGDAVGDARYVAQASYRRGDGFRVEPFESTDGLLKIALDTSSSGTAVLKLGVHDDAADSGAVGLTRDMFARDPERSTVTPDDHMHFRRYEVSLIHDQRLLPSLTLRTTVFAYTASYLWRRQQFDRVPDITARYERIAGDPSLPGGAIYFRDADSILDRSYDVAGVEPRLSHRVATGSVEHVLDYGARLMGEGAHLQLRTGETSTSYAGTLDDDEEHQTVAFAAFFQDRIAFRDDLLVVPGVRFEHAGFRRTILRGRGEDGPADTDLSEDTQASAIIPGIGFVYGLTPIQLLAGLHLGWAPPRLGAAVSPNGTPTDPGGDESLSYEAGTRTSPTPWLRANATGFVTDFRNQVLLGGDRIGTTAVVTEGPTRHLGVEASAALELGKAIGIDTALDFGARCYAAKAFFKGGEDDGNILPYSPQQTFGANVDVEHPTGLGGQVAYAFTGPQFTDTANAVQVDATGRVGRIPAWHVVDATARYRHAPTGLSFRVTVKNALDDVYVVARRPEGIFGAGYRQITLGARWDYDEAPQGMGASTMSGQEE